MDTFTHHTSWAYSPPKVTYSYSPAIGRSLLQDAGWILPASGDIRMKDGKQLALTITTGTSEMRTAIMPIFEDQMRACGIRVIIDQRPGSWWFGDKTGLAVRDFELGEFAWLNDPDDPEGDYQYACDQIPNPANNWVGGNFMGWCNPTASDAILQASDISLPQADRQVHYATFIDLFAEDLPSLPLFAREGRYDIWEHIDFNLETYSQLVDTSFEEDTTLIFTNFAGNQGSFFIPAGVVTPTKGIMSTPLWGTLAEAPDHMTRVGNFRLTALQEGVPLGEFTISEPMTLTHSFHIFRSDVLYEDTLNFYFWDGQDWMPAVESCPEGKRFVDLNMENDTLVTRICHFSEFSMMAKEEFTIYQPLIVLGN